MTDESRFAGRRNVMKGAGALGAAALVAAAATPAHADQGRIKNFGLPTVKPGEDLGKALLQNAQVQLVPGETYTLASTVDVPDECFIAGNGATITVASTAVGALHVSGKRNVTIRDVFFLGQPTSPLNSAQVVSHVGVRVTRGTNVRILDCDFENWRGAGVLVTGASEDDYFAYRVKVIGNSFHQCYFGLSAADRSEYSLATANSFSYCRLAVWNSSGNWMVNDNDIVGCYGALYTMNATSPYGALASDNWAHGSFCGNTANHSNGGAKALWNQQTAFPVSGITEDPGPGVVVRGVLPPTFTANTLWYTDVRATNLVGTRWLISGCTLSNLTVTADGPVPVVLVGTQSNGPGNAPRLVGNAKDALASLY